MIRSSLVLWMVVAVGASGFLYHTSYAVQADERQLAAVNDEILRAEDGLRVLRAEQAYLTAPGRIEKLAQANLDMEPVDPRQVKSDKQFFGAPMEDARIAAAKSEAPPRRAANAAPALRHVASAAVPASASKRNANIIPAAYHAGHAIVQARAARQAKPHLILTAERQPEEMQDLLARVDR